MSSPAHKYYSRMETARHELLSDIADQIALVLHELNIDGDVAEQCGEVIANHLAEHWAGQHITIPKDYAHKISARNLQIWEEFDGSNHRELAKKYGITPNAIYRIIKQTHRLAMNATQADFFEQKKP